MKTHPTKLLILFPMYTPVEYRHRLDAIDDALVVHRRVSGEFQFELRPMIKLSARGASSYGAALQRLATDLEAGYIVVVVDRDRFLADLEALAREHAIAKDRGAVECAAQVIAERTTFQIRDHLDSSAAQYRVNRMLVASRARRTKAYPHESNGLNCQNGIPTPRTEQLWHLIRHELTSPRDNQAGMAAWERWCRGNRPDMPWTAG